MGATQVTDRYQTFHTKPEQPIQVGSSPHHIRAIMAIKFVDTFYPVSRRLSRKVSDTKVDEDFFPGPIALIMISPLLYQKIPYLITNPYKPSGKNSRSPTVQYRNAITSLLARS